MITSLVLLVRAGAANSSGRAALAISSLESKISANSDGTISVDEIKDLNGEPKKFREIGPLMFREIDGQDRIAFKHDHSGNLVLVIDFPFMVFEKARLYENSVLNLPLIISSLAVLLLTVLLWPIIAVLQRHYGRKVTLSPGERRLRLLVRIVCILDLVFFAGFARFFAMAFKDIGLLSPHYNPWLRLIQIVGWLGILGTLIVIYNVVRSWKQPQRWLWARLGDTLIALACLGTTWFVFTWSMLHWSLSY